MKKLFGISIFVFILFIPISNAQTPQHSPTKFILSSAAFNNEERIPARYSDTHRGRNLSPPLKWENPPKGTRYFALIATDVDAPILGTISHWVLYNIPSEERELPEGLVYQSAFQDGMIQGRNFYRQNAYMGPSPPFGTHRYYFTIYALDAKITPDPKMDRIKLMKAMAKHVLSQAKLVGRYSKK